MFLDLFREIIAEKSIWIQMEIYLRLSHNYKNTSSISDFSEYVICPIITSIS